MALNSFKLSIQLTELKNRVKKMTKPNISFDYDDEADVLYINLGLNEPSYCEEVDDLLLIERGYFSHRISGFQIIDLKHHGITGVKIERYIKKAINKEREYLDKIIEQGESLPGLISKNLARNKRLQNILQDA